VAETLASAAVVSPCGVALWWWQVSCWVLREQARTVWWGCVSGGVCCGKLPLALWLGVGVVAGALAGCLLRIV
jgi:hypothetical protein